MQERSLEWYKKLFKQIMADDMEDYQNQYDIYQLLLNFKNDFDMQDLSIRDYAMKISKYAHGMADYMAGQTGSGKFNELYYDLLRIESPFLVDSFMRYIESNKPINKQFYTPRAHTLKKIIDAYQEVFDGKLDFLSVSQPKRTGKALPVYTKVTTPTGRKMIGDIKVGDMVISKSGKPTVVTAIYPQGKQRVYEIDITESGKAKQKTTIECCKNHLWEVRTEEDREKRKGKRVMSTIELLNGTLYRGHDKHNNYSIDYVLPIEFQRQEVEINPYLLGALIGDGGLTGGKTYFSNTEVDVLEKVKNCVATYGCDFKYVKDCTYSITGGTLRSKLRECGLVEKLSFEKKIPNNYLLNTIDIRTELLRGILDTDGYVDKNGIEYSTTSQTLCEQVIWIVKSLGGKASFAVKQGAYRKNGVKIETREFYRVFINFPRGIIPVSSKKHIKKYNPKRSCLYHFISDIRETNRYEEMVCISVSDNDELYLLDENFILTHNTSAGLRLALMMGGRNPDGSVFATGKGEGLVKSFYGGMLEVLDDPTSKYYDVFPEARLVRTKADEMTIDLKNKSRFSTFTCRPIDGSVVGNTEANVLLYIDDCVKNHEEARNRDRLEFLCEKITDDILGRRIEGTPIIIQGTKYSLYDPITFLQEKANELEWRWKEVAIPALDPITDESNFEIIKDGKRIFTTEYYRKEKKLVTDETWASEFQQEPYEAKGRMFPEKDLKTYFELPVDKDPDSILAVCDTAESGADSTAMPIAYIYGEDVFIEDVVFDNSPSDVTKPECAKKLVEHKVPTAVFESNNAGTYFARDVEEEVKKLGGKCSIRTKRTISNKLTRIEYASDNIKLHFYFKDKSTYEADSQYARFMKEVFKMTRSGKVAHDDAPDSLSLLENELRNILVASVKAVKNPLWR